MPCSRALRFEPLNRRGKTSNIEHPTSNIQHPTSNIQSPRSAPALDIGCSMLTGRELKSHEALLAINAAVAGRLLGGGFEGGQDVSRLLQSQAKLLPIVGSSSVVRPFIQPARRAPRGVLSLPRSMPTVYANASPGQGQGFEQRGILVLGWAQGGQIQVGFVNGHLLKCGPRSPDKLHDLARLLPVMVHPGPDKDALRAKPFGCGAGQGRPTGRRTSALHSWRHTRPRAGLAAHRRSPACPARPDRPFAPRRRRTHPCPDGR